MVFKRKLMFVMMKKKLFRITTTPSHPSVLSSRNILLLSEEAQIIAIDEAQFFDDELPHVCTQLANQGKRVIVAGLDMDYKGNHSDLFQT